MKKRLTGFTLIELLIVVAIIAILAAIAVPNFLEAQTRSKVSRVYADFRNLAVAIEAHRTDNAEYLPSHFSTGTMDFIQGTRPLRRLNPLTTPVAYLSKVPDGTPFKDPHEPDTYWVEWQYSTTKGLLNYERGGAPNFGLNGESQAYLNGFYRMAAGRQPNFVAGAANIFRDGPAWLILDRGPDRALFFIWTNPGWPSPDEYDFPFGPIPLRDAAVFYDPTNGTISGGDIMRSQMKSSFQ
jgi:prepilin-type N-terminal cleavage/methylation domain-containing protein